jgi:ribosomal protein S19
LSKFNKLDLSTYFSQPLLFKKQRKLNYLAPSLLRSVFLIKSNPIHNFSEKKVFARSSRIPNLYSNQEVLIYNGRRFKQKCINKWCKGYRFGEFT